MEYMPDFDPLMMIVGLFVLMAAAQHLGFANLNAEDERRDGSADSRASGSSHKDAEDKQDRGSSLEVQLAEADRCIQQNNYERAINLAKKATDLDPECAKAWELLATAQKWAGQRAEALETVKTARDLYEVQSEKLTALLKELGQTESPAAIANECETKGEEFIARRMYDLALPCFSQAIEALEVSLEVMTAADRSLELRLFRRRAECAQQLQDWGLCRRDATSLLEADPNDARALLQRAAANEALEKFKAALEDARKLLTIDPKSAAANRIVNNCRQALMSD